jgi:CheY-like chemotaxis protein/HPt (histidine-containing phosphotransfer) domain-containing protein
MEASSNTPLSSHLLLVEDDKDLADALQTGLEDNSLKLTVVGSATDALEKLRGRAFNLILLDLGLPGMNGFDLLALLKSQPEWRQVPVIMLTANGNIKDKVRGFEAGAVDYITKPFDLVELRARVRSTLRMQQLQRELLQANHNLRAARQAAEDTAGAKAEFLANMSHEIRTPMNGVIAMTGLLMQTDLAADQRDFVETIRTSGESLLTIINDILNFSKLESGKMELERQPMNLRACIEEALDLLASKAAEKDLDLACHIASDVPEQVLGDVTRLRQILVNLVSNAIKFTFSGEICIRIARSPRPASAPGAISSLHFSVRDTGIGIPTARLGRLFHSFSQVDSSIARQYGGTGLGLAISKGLVELMGGNMWVESFEGEGSTFHFDLPLAVATIPSQSTLQQAQPKLVGLRVLIVEDNATSRFVLGEQISRWGVIPIEAQSGQHALDVVRSGSNIDLAIIDSKLPGLGFSALVSELRKLPGLEGLSVLALVSVLNHGTRLEGFSGLQINKPAKPAQLLTALLQLRSGVSPSQQKVQFKSKLDSSMANRLPLRILLTDDNAINRKVALRLLQQLGYKADTASNGLEALRAIENNSYDLVLMDVQMPELDGLAATRQIRALQANSSAPRSLQQRIVIVAMTANAMQGDREKCLAAGMDDYLPKPVRPESLQAMLELHGKELTKSAVPTPVSSVVEIPVVSPSTSPTPALTVLPSPVLEGAVEEPPPVDMERLSDFAGGNIENFNELVALYVKQTTEQLEQLRAALVDNDAEQTARIAHSCAGASATCGMVALLPLLRQMENLGQEKQLGFAAQLLPSLDREFGRLQHYLETHKPIALAG